MIRILKRKKSNGKKIFYVLYNKLIHILRALEDQSIMHLLKVVGKHLLILAIFITGIYKIKIGE